MRYAIVTDSTSDLPVEWAEKYQIAVLPAVIVIDGKEYLDGEGLSREEFYNRLPDMADLPTTAAPSVGAFGALYARLFDAGVEHILSIHLAANLSGLINSAIVAAADFMGRVTVVDSEQISMGLGFQAVAAAEAVQAGKELEGIKQAIVNTRLGTHVVAMLDTLEYLRRSGRVSNLRASLGSMLRMRLFVGIEDGRVVRLDQSRTRHKAIERLGEMLKDSGPFHRLAVLHSNAERDAREFLRTYAPDFVNRAPIINVTSIIGTHVGPQGIGFAVVV